MMTFALFLGCTIPARLNQYESSSRAILEKLGVGLVDIREFNCCGYPLRNIDFKVFILSSARNLALVEKKNLNVMTLCKCCEGGLVASLEKFVLDVELLRQFRRQMDGIGFSDEELAFDALKEVGPGGLWLAAKHRRAHFKEWLYVSPLFQTQDFSTWEMSGAETTDKVANRLWKQLLDTYEDPGLDETVDQELQAFMERRKAEPPPREDD